MLRCIKREDKRKQTVTCDCDREALEAAQAAYDAHEGDDYLGFGGMAAAVAVYVERMGLEKRE